MSTNHQIKAISASEPSVLFLVSDPVTADTSSFLSLPWQTWVGDDFEEHLPLWEEAGNFSSVLQWSIYFFPIIEFLCVTISSEVDRWGRLAWHRNKSFRFQPQPLKAQLCEDRHGGTALLLTSEVSQSTHQTIWGSAKSELIQDRFIHKADS